MLGVTGAGRRATTRLLDAEFPRFRQLIPAEHTTSADRRGRRADRVDQARRAGHRPRRQVRMEFADGRAAPHRGRRRRGQRRGGAPCELEGAPLTIAFNPGYLLDALGVLHAERARSRSPRPTGRRWSGRSPPPPAEGSEEAACRRGAGLPPPVDARTAARLSLALHLRRLAVTDFRSWEAAELDLAPGVTVLVGPNGVGKTNLVEAAGYLATLGSHRVAGDAPLIRRGAGRPSSAGRWCTSAASCRSRWRSPRGGPTGRGSTARRCPAPRRARHPAHGPVRPRGPRARPRRPGRAPSLPRRPARRRVRPARRRPRRLRPGAAPAHALLKTAGARPRRRDLRTLDVWDGHSPARRGAAGRPARARRGARPARRSRRSPRSRRRREPSGWRYRSARGSTPPAPRPRSSRPRCSRRWPRCAGRRWSAGCASSARTATTSSSGSATGRPRATPATASRGRWRSRCGWRPPAAARRGRRAGPGPRRRVRRAGRPPPARARRTSPRRAEQVLVTAAVDEDVPDGARRRPVRGERRTRSSGCPRGDVAARVIDRAWGQSCGYCG